MGKITRAIEHVDVDELITRIDRAKDGCAHSQTAGHLECDS